MRENLLSFVQGGSFGQKKKRMFSSVGFFYKRFRLSDKCIGVQFFFVKGNVFLLNNQTSFLLNLGLDSLCCESAQRNI